MTRPRTPTLFIAALALLTALACPPAPATAQDGPLRIAIFDFKNLTDHQALGAEVAEEVRGRLSDLSDVVVVEREQLRELVLKEMERMQSGYMEADAFDTEIAVKGIDVQVTGKVLSMKLDSRVSDNPKTVRYVERTDMVPNPEYQRLMRQQQLQQQQQQYQARDKASALLQGLGSMFGEMALQNTPQYIERPVYGNWTYYERNHTKTAHFKMSMKIVNNLDGVVLFNRVISKTARDQDLEIQGDPGRGVNSDPLDISSDFELQERVKAAAINDIVALVRQALGKHGNGAEVQAVSPAEAQPAGGGDLMVRFQRLKDLFDSGLITQQEYDERRARLLDESF